MTFDTFTDAVFPKLGTFFVQAYPGLGSEPKRFLSVTRIGRIPTLVFDWERPNRTLPRCLPRHAGYRLQRYYLLGPKTSS